jgi:hypothetical protein
VDPSLPETLHPVFQLFSKDVITKRDFEKALRVLQLEAPDVVAQQAWRHFHDLKRVDPRILAQIARDNTSTDRLQTLSSVFNVQFKNIDEALEYGTSHQDSCFVVNNRDFPELRRRLIRDFEWLLKPASRETQWALALRGRTASTSSTRMRLTAAFVRNTHLLTIVLILMLSASYVCLVKDLIGLVTFLMVNIPAQVALEWVRIRLWHHRRSRFE